MKAATIETLVSDAVLQAPVGTITIDGREYSIDRPRVRTLIVVSEIISRLPAMDVKADSIEKKIIESLRAAKDCSLLGEIAAVLILGAKNLTEERKIEKRRFFGLFKSVKTVTVDARKELADRLLMELDCESLKELIETCLAQQQIPCFFQLTTSLYGVNLLRPTEVAKTTAFGR